MIRRVIVGCFKKLRHLEFSLDERVLIAGPNNSGKSTLLQALAVWSELGEIWLESNAEPKCQDYQGLHRMEMDVASLSTVALSSFDGLWNDLNTREPITIKVTTDDWDVGFELNYQDSTTATAGPTIDTSAADLQAFAKSPLKALYVPSLSGLDINEFQYSEKTLAALLAHGKGGMVLRNMIQSASRDEAKWKSLQSTIKSFFGFELSIPSGAAPITARYRHSEKDHWYDLPNGAAGFLQTILVQSALLHSDAKLFLIDEPDAHLHALLKAKMYRLIREHCKRNNCQVVIATHSGRLIEEAGSEQGNKLVLVTANGLKPVRRRDAQVLSAIPTEQIMLAETTQRVLYVEGRSDVDILREWANVLDHPARSHLDQGFWVPTAEQKGRAFAKRHFRALKAQVPALRGLEMRDRNGAKGKKWEGLELGKLRIEEERKQTPEGMKVIYWTRCEIENYLIHPNAILRFVSRLLGEEGKEKVKCYMEKYLPRMLFERPFETTELDEVKGKIRITRILSEVKAELGEGDYCQLAAAMMPEEVHPDVVAMLNEIKEHLASEVSESRE